MEAFLFLFQMNRDNSGNSIDLTLVGKCPLSLSHYRKEEIIRSMNLINGFSARGYSIHGVHLPNSPFNVIACKVHSLSSRKGKMFLFAACHAFTPHVNAWKN